MRININKYAAHFSILYISLAAFTLFSATAVNNYKPDEIPEEQRLTGIAICGEGMPIEGLEVFLFGEPEDYPETIYASTITGEDGTFMFNTVRDKNYLIELRGESGSGRVALHSQNLIDTLRISYPVVEQIVLLHTNDQHFTLNNLNEFKSAVKRIRNKYEDVFLLSTGDIFVRHPFRWIVNGRLMKDPGWYGERAMSFPMITLFILGKLL